MTVRRLRLATLLVITGAVAWLFIVTPLRAARQRTADATASLPSSLTDAEFWRLIEEFSEPDGYFDSDNLLSNETTFQYVIPSLTQTVKPGRAYLGVGPEQNFTYIVALRPAIAFIPDIRRGNLQEHLLYKALIEMAADRADFLSRLFSRARPSGLGPETGVDALMSAYAGVQADQALYRRNLAAVKSWLTEHHRFALHPGDADGVEYVYDAFRQAGPSLSYLSARPQRSRYPTYRELQEETDGQGTARGYLASEANFRTLQAFETRNLIVPLVADFAGPQTLRAVGGYLKQHGATVGAFYTSNVENYLFQGGTWGRFAGNVGTLPIDASSTFVRACFDSCGGAAGSRSTMLLDAIAPLLQDFNEGKIRTYGDVLFRQAGAGRER